MRDWLTIELLLSTLLVTSFTCIGLLALWAATSPRHWFVRTGVVLASLSPMLLVPAIEPFIAFVIQSVVVLVAVTCFRWRAGDRHGNIDRDNCRHSGIQFSLSTLMLIMVLLAVGIVIALRLPKLNLAAWATVAIDSGLAGFVTIVGAWMPIARRKIVDVPLGLIACAVLGVIPAWQEWFVPSMLPLHGWPPDVNASGFLGTGEVQRPVIAWFFILPAVACLIAAFTGVWPIAFGTMLAFPTNCRSASCLKVRWLTRTVLTLSAIVMAAFPLYVLAELLTPDPIPTSSNPPGNAYPDFIVAGQIIAKTQLDGTIDVDAATAQQLTAELAKCDKAFALIDVALGKSCVVPVDYSSSGGDLSMCDILAIRPVARALYARGRLAELENRYTDAANSYMNAICFGYAARRGGLLVDALVGTGCSYYGTNQLYHLRDKLEHDQVNRSIAELNALDANDEPYEVIWQRDRVWTQRACGWHGHLQQLLEETLGGDQKLAILFGATGYSTVFWTHQATIRLLIVELALTRFYQDNGHWPESLSKLIPKYLESVPIDALDPAKRMLHYRREASGYLLYSVGPNCIDDGGAKPNKDDFPRMPQTGDLRLDDYFGPYE